MPFTDGYANDVDFVVDATTLTITGVRSGADFTDTVAGCKPLDSADARAFFGGVGFGPKTKGFIIPNNNLSNVDVLDLGDVINDGSHNWIVDGVEHVHFGHQWVVRCTRGR